MDGNKVDKNVCGVANKEMDEMVIDTEEDKVERGDEVNACGAVNKEADQMAMVNKEDKVGRGDDGSEFRADGVVSKLQRNKMNVNKDTDKRMDKAQFTEDRVMSSCGDTDKDADEGIENAQVVLSVEVDKVDADLEKLRDEEVIEQLDGCLDVNPEEFDRIENEVLYISSGDEEMPSLEEVIISDGDDEEVVLVSGSSDEDEGEEDPADVMINYMELSTYITEDDVSILMDRDSTEDNVIWDYVVGARGEILAYDRMIVAYGEIESRVRDRDEEDQVEQVREDIERSERSVDVSADLDECSVEDNGGYEDRVVVELTDDEEGEEKEEEIQDNSLVVIDNDGVRVIAAGDDIMEDREGVIGVGRDNPVRLVVRDSNGAPSYIEGVENVEVGGMQIEGVLRDVGDSCGGGSDISTEAERGEDDLPLQ